MNAKVWSGTEPSAWSTTATDSTSGLQSAGAVGVGGFLSGGATNAPQKLSVDTVRVTTVG